MFDNEVKMKFCESNTHLLGPILLNLSFAVLTRLSIKFPCKIKVFSHFHILKIQFSWRLPVANTFHQNNKLNHHSRKSYKLRFARMKGNLGDLGWEGLSKTGRSRIVSRVFVTVSYTAIVSAVCSSVAILPLARERRAQGGSCD